MINKLVTAVDESEIPRSCWAMLSILETRSHSALNIQIFTKLVTSIEENISFLFSLAFGTSCERDELVARAKRNTTSKLHVLGRNCLPSRLHEIGPEFAGEIPDQQDITTGRFRIQPHQGLGHILVLSIIRTATIFF